MMLFILSYLAGALTIFAPCVLPVLPFIFARVDQPFLKSGLPLLAGMASTFALVATLGAVAGNWAIQANDYGRSMAMVVLALMGMALLAPAWSERLGRPLIALGSRLSGASRIGNNSRQPSALSSFILGGATGLLWAPCAGPILGLVLTGAALEGPSIRTSLLLLAYASGAATSLALALVAGGRLLASMKRSLKFGDWLRKGLGVAVLAGVSAIALGLDTGWLAQFSPEGTAQIEQGLLRKLPTRSPSALAERTRGGIDLASMAKVAAPAPLNLPVEGNMPELVGATGWINSPPLTRESLTGKVVLVDFWTFGCYNCRNALPYVREWHRKYKDQGLVVLSVHSPEFAYEKNEANVRKAVKALGVEFPVALDNNFTLWRSYNNQYWPALYFVDSQGKIRRHYFGEGDYDTSERVIQQLLQEARSSGKSS